MRKSSSQIHTFFMILLLQQEKNNKKSRLELIQINMPDKMKGKWKKLRQKAL